MDARFPTAYEGCEDFGHDLETGAEHTPEQYRATDPRGKARIKAAAYQPPHEQPDADYPLWLTTGRLVYHFHTRTKTGRTPELQAAAPEAFVELCREDAERYGVADGDLVAVVSRRGRIEVPARMADLEPGHLFVPFHYGWWDDATRARAANELTRTEWDPVSKQPHYKYAAVRLEKIGPLTATVQAAARGVTGAVAGAADAVAGALRGKER